MKNWKLWVGVLVIFASGIAIGFSLGGVHTRRTVEHIFSDEHHRSQEFIVKKLTRELNLTESQREYVEKVLCRTHAKLFRIRQERLPEIKGIIESGIVEMKQQLSPEQGRKLDEFYAKARKRWEHARERRGRNGRSNCE